MDPSISSTGVVVLTETAQTFRRVQTKDRGQSIDGIAARIRESVTGIYNAVEPILVGLGLSSVDLVVIEQPAFGKNNANTHRLAGHWWMTVHVLSQFGPVAQVNPGTAKKFATGNGRAEKDEVLAAAIAAFPGGAIRNNDVADASVFAAMGAVHLGMEFGGGFASSGRASVQAVHWPLIGGDGL